MDKMWWRWDETLVWSRRVSPFGPFWCFSPHYSKEDSGRPFSQFDWRLSPPSPPRSWFHKAAGNFRLQWYVIASVGDRRRSGHGRKKAAKGIGSIIHRGNVNKQRDRPAAEFKTSLQVVPCSSWGCKCCAVCLSDVSMPIMIGGRPLLSSAQLNAYALHASIIGSDQCGIFAHFPLHFAFTVSGYLSAHQRLWIFWKLHVGHAVPLAIAWKGPAGTIAYQRPANLAVARRRPRRCSLLLVFSLGTCCFACQPPYSSEFLFAGLFTDRKHVHHAHFHMHASTSQPDPPQREHAHRHTARRLLGGNIMNLTELQLWIESEKGDASDPFAWRNRTPIVPYPLSERETGHHQSSHTYSFGKACTQR
jgi:hypothetical protein